MLRSERSTPPEKLFPGELGDELIVLSLSELRIAERLEREEVLHTADGQVAGRVGDFVVASASERYPIRASVFYGTYQILDSVGSFFVGKRLLHARRAWPSLAHAEFDYGPDRGKVSASKDSWVYQSDDNDFGLINSEAKGRGHVVVGTAHELATRNWEHRFQRAALAISILPPLLTLISILAYSAALHESHPVALFLLVIEVGFLAAGVAAVWWIRKARWALKAALSSGTRVALDFQVAVRLLGQKDSALFPGMALWRAAQSSEPLRLSLSKEELRMLKDQIYKTYDHLQHEVHTHHRTELRASALSWLVAGTILICIIHAGLTHSLWSEFLAVWLPSVAGAVHASSWRRQLVGRVAAGRQFLSELEFAKSQLLSLVPHDKIEESGIDTNDRLFATLRMLCRAAAQHTQRQLRFAMAEDPNVPV